MIDFVRGSMQFQCNFNVILAEPAPSKVVGVIGLTRTPKISEIEMIANDICIHQLVLEKYSLVRRRAGHVCRV